jgi:organic radical activating enzyme
MVKEILSDLAEVPHTALIVITGGEPFRQSIGPLINALVDQGHYVQIETNGVLPPAPGVVYNLEVGQRRGAYIVCSPKTNRVAYAIWNNACCAKYVLDGAPALDGLPVTALGHRADGGLARPPEGWNRTIYLQPADEQDEAKNEYNLKQAVASAMANGYIVQLQIHKILSME